VAAFTDATHGHTLAAVSGAYYRLLISKSPDAAQKFKRLAMNVWNVSAEGKAAIEREESDARINYPEREQARPKVKTDEQVAMEGLETMEQWMRELGLAMNITDCGAKPEQIEGMADACPICQGGYYILNRDEVVQVLKDSL
jgi:alcohol dehydrogenase YqhD (iron-dependent ADH family)